MRSSWRRACFVGIVLSCLAPVDAQDATRNITLSSVLNSDKLLTLSPWLVHDGELLCVVSEKIGMFNQSKSVIHVLTVYRHQGPNLVKIFETEKVDGIVNVSPLAQYDGDLLVGWVRDGAYHLEVYEYSDGKVERALDASSGAMPEILYGADGRPVILITNEVLVEGRGWIRNANSTADVYKRNGKTYEKIAQVPWPKRLQDVPVTTGVPTK